MEKSGIVINLIHTRGLENPIKKWKNLQIASMTDV